MTPQMARFLAADSMVTGGPRWDSFDWDSVEPGDFLEFLDQTEPVTADRTAHVDKILDHLSGFGFEGDYFEDADLSGLRAD
jgi:hypothetical protein